MKQVSVLMSTYKEPVVFIEKAVASILNQTYPIFEFIIILDDPNNVELRKKLEKYAVNNTSIRLLYNEQNLGLVGSLNRALKECHGEYIARMDADDISHLNRIKTQVEFIENHSCDLIGAGYEMFTSENRKCREYLFPRQHKQCINWLRKNTCVPHPLWFGKREVFIAMNGYREITTCEDFDFIIRAVLAGYQLGNCKEILLKYRYNPNSISRKRELEQSLVASFLAENFRKDRMVTIEEYQNYLCSDEFRNEMQYGQMQAEKKKRYYEQKNLFVKLKILLSLVLNRQFIKSKIKHKK